MKITISHEEFNKAVEEAVQDTLSLTDKNVVVQGFVCKKFLRKIGMEVE
jgi:uncharacterized membrane protein YcgQ (UPF0703/DUF1980 family)